MSLRSSPARVLRPPDRLAALVARPGGLPRAFAVARAERRLEAQRSPAMKALHILIETLAAMAGQEQPLMPGELPHLRRVAGQLVSLALIYDQDMLAEAGMKLCDLIAAFARDGRLQRDAVHVHVHAMRLLAPGRQPGAAAVNRMLEELDRVLVHFGAMPG